MKNKLMAGLLSSMAALTAALCASSALAFEPFTVRDIRVEGIQRTEAGTVFSYLPVKVGDTMTDDKAAQAIKALFGTGFFKDVRIEIDKDVLVVILEERPAIASIDFNGLKAFKKDDLLKGLKEVGLAESRIFDRALIERAEQELKRQYLAQGYYAVSLTTTVTPLERNRVGISVTVEEGDIAKIRQINLVGAKAFKESELLDLFTLRTPGFLTWYTKNDQYSKQKLSADIETLRSFYLDRGYMEFNVESTQVQISPSKEDIYITINMSEGEKYTISSVKLAGNLMLPEAELTKLVLVKPGDVFSREKMTETTKAISERLGNEGYAFANVNAAPELDKAKRTAAFTIFVDPGRRVYVRRIGVTGNNKTRDEVIRREMRQLEAAWYDGEKINRSKKRVDRLGYFEEVTIETPPVAGTTDQVDVNVNVKEKPTGNVSLGAGYSSTEGLTFSTSIQQNNMFGSGRYVGFAINTSKVNTLYSLSYTNPYFTVDGTAFGFDVYHRDLDTSSTDVGSFGSRATGGGLRLGLPISEENFVNLGLSGDRTKLKVDQYSPQQYQDYVRDFGEYMQPILEQRRSHPGDPLRAHRPRIRAAAECRTRLGRRLQRQAAALLQEPLGRRHWLGPRLRRRLARPLRSGDRGSSWRHPSRRRQHGVPVPGAGHGQGSLGASRRLRRRRPRLGQQQQPDGAEPRQRRWRPLQRRPFGGVVVAGRPPQVQLWRPAQQERR